jgi:hypothetical protein
MVFTLTTSFVLFAACSGATLYFTLQRSGKAPGRNFSGPPLVSTLGTEVGTRRNDKDMRGGDYYYGGARSQREDWDHRAFDNNDFDRREGMYEAGGRDFDERLHDNNPDDRGSFRGNYQEPHSSHK